MIYRHEIFRQRVVERKEKRLIFMKANAYSERTALQGFHVMLPFVILPQSKYWRPRQYLPPVIINPS